MVKKLLATLVLSKINTEICGQKEGQTDRRDSPYYALHI
jgi:hypothetical protein